MTVFEAMLHARQDLLGRKGRWVGNLFAVIISAWVRILLPATLMGAIWAQQQGVGIFNFVMETTSLEVIATIGFQSAEPSQRLIFTGVVALSILLLDMIIY